MDFRPWKKTLKARRLREWQAHVPAWMTLMLVALSVLVLILDMLQYVAITNVAESTYRRAENDGKTEGILYDPGSRAYKAQAFFYHFKFIVLIIASVGLGVVFAMLFVPATK
jgi:hypothetical protein